MMRKLLFVMMAFVFALSLTVGGQGIVGAAEPTAAPRHGRNTEDRRPSPYNVFGVPSENGCRVREAASGSSHREPISSGQRWSNSALAGDRLENGLQRQDNHSYFEERG